jgi:hypothetical protein
MTDRRQCTLFEFAEFVFVGVMVTLSKMVVLSRHKRIETSDDDGINVVPSHAVGFDGSLIRRSHRSDGF